MSTDGKNSADIVGQLGSGTHSSMCHNTCVVCPSLYVWESTDNAWCEYGGSNNNNNASSNIVVGSNAQTSNTVGNTSNRNAMEWYFE